MKNSETIKSIMPAYVKAVGELKSVKKDAKNPFLKNKYASLDAIIDASKPILSDNKLAVIQMLCDNGVETIILHESGEWISSDYLQITPEQSKGLSIAQSIGVATTYAKRYQLAAILGISSDEDTDGQYAGNENLQPVYTDSRKVTEKPIITNAQLQQAVKRARDGEEGVYEKMVSNFRLLKEHQDAWNYAMEHAQ